MTTIQGNRTDEELSPEEQRVASGTKRIGDTYVSPAPLAPSEPTTVDAFVVGKSPMAAKRAKNTLNISVRNKGRLITRRALVDAKVAAGSEIKYSKSGTRRLQAADGSYLDESQIGKTAMDYAEYQIDGR